MTVHRGALPIALACLALLAAALLAPSAAADVEGEVRYDLVSLEEAEIHASVNLTGEHAQALREQVDRDDDGEVGALEAAGATIVIEDRIEGTTEAYTLDGNAYENERVGARQDGLKGPVEAEEPVHLDVRIEAEAEAGQAPHVFAVNGLPGNLTEDARLTHTVHAPEGYAIQDADGFRDADGCRATAPPGTGNASVELAAVEEGCQRPVPGAGLATVLVGLAGLAWLGADRRTRT